MSKPITERYVTELLDDSKDMQPKISEEWVETWNGNLIHTFLIRVTHKRLIG